LEEEPNSVVKTPKIALHPYILSSASGSTEYTMSINHPERMSKFIPPSERNNFLGTGSKQAYEELMRRKRRNANLTATLLGLGAVCLFAFPYYFVTWKNEQNKNNKSYGNEKGFIKSIQPTNFSLMEQVQAADPERQQREQALALLRAKKRELEALNLQEENGSK